MSKTKSPTPAQKRAARITGDALKKIGLPVTYTGSWHPAPGNACTVRVIYHDDKRTRATPICDAHTHVGPHGDLFVPLAIARKLERRAS